MKQYQKVRSTMQPEPIVIDDYSVWVAENITPVTEEATGDGTGGFEGYEYDLTQYEKDEYIQRLDTKNQLLESQITDAYLALCNVYELAGGEA